MPAADSVGDVAVLPTLWDAARAAARAAASQADSDAAVLAAHKKALAAAKSGDKAGANAAIKALVKDTKLTKYVSDGIISGSKFVDAVGMPSGYFDPDNKAL